MNKITLGTKGLIERDGTFVMEPSDFADLSLFIEAVLSSNLVNDTVEAYARYPYRTVQVRPGRTINSDNVFLDIIDNYNSARMLSANVYEHTSPMITLMCTKIARYAQEATTTYGDLFAAARDYAEDPEHDGPRALVLGIIGPLKTEIDFVIDLATKVYDEFRTFEDGVTKAEATLSDRYGLLKELEAYLKTEFAKLKSTSRDYQTFKRSVDDNTLVDTDIVKISTKWQPALTTVQRLIGAWQAIKADLTDIETMITTDALFQNASIILDLNEQNILEEWKKLGQEAAKYSGKNRSFLIRS